MIATIEQLALQVATRGLGSLSAEELDTLREFGRWLLTTREGQQRDAQVHADARNIMELAAAQPEPGARPS